MNSHGITKENLLKTFPTVLSGDAVTAALADAAAEAMAKLAEEMDCLLIYPRVEQLEDDLLNLMAFDFKVDWWDANYSLLEKRRTIQGNWQVHRTLGTKAAVETALRAIYPDAEVREWFEYGGEPYHFRLCVDFSSKSADAKKNQAVLSRINSYKNLRSVLDEVEYFEEGQASSFVASACISGSIVDGAVAK